MAKSAIRRHHTRRLINKWTKLKNTHKFSIHEDNLSFGRIFSKDPIDCGQSNCCVCGSYDWLYDSTKPKNNNIDFAEYEWDYLYYYDDVYLYP